MPWLAEDTERLEKFRRGDRTTLEEVYDHYAAPLSRAVARLCASDPAHAALSSRHLTPFQVEDIVQECLIRAFGDGARRAYDPKRPFTAFLVGIARHVVADRVRIAARRRKLEVEAGVPNADADASVPSPERATLAREVAELYREFMASLSEIERRVVKLRWEESGSRRFVEEGTGLSAMQVRTAEAKIRKKLARILKEKGCDMGLVVTEPPHKARGV